MKKGHLQNALGFGLFGAYVVIAAWLFLHSNRFGDQFGKALQMLSPLFFVHITSFVQFLIANAAKPAKPAQVGGAYAAMCLLLTLTVSVATLAILIARSNLYGLNARDPEAFVSWLAWVQAGQGVLLGHFVSSLFGRPQHS